MTGATGFVGRVLCEELANNGHSVRAALRTPIDAPAGVKDVVVVGEHGSTTDWSDALHDVECVVHAAARVHMMDDSPANANLYLETNVRGTQRLAEASARAGVRRFVYLSSIKVNGEATQRRPFTAADAPLPLDAYGISKLQAEQAVLGISAATGMSATIIRPPLVYGPGVRANFLRLLSWVYRGIPLPLGAVRNSRSMVNVWNLCDLIRRCLEADAAAAGVLMVSDGEDVSTPQLIHKLADAMDRPARLFSVPVTLLKIGAAVTGKRAEVGRLLGSLQIDSSATCQALNWTPPLSVGEGLARTARWYVESRSVRIS